MAAVLLTDPDWSHLRSSIELQGSTERLSSRLDPEQAGKRLANCLRVLTLEAQTLARACGTSNLAHLEPEDLVALTVEASAMARVPLAGTSWIRGGGGQGTY